MSKKFSEFSDEEIKKRYKHCIDVYKSGNALLEDVTTKMKLNRFEISILHNEIKKRNIKIEE